MAINYISSICHSARPKYSSGWCVYAKAASVSPNRRSILRCQMYSLSASSHVKVRNEDVSYRSCEPHRLTLTSSTLFLKKRFECDELCMQLLILKKMTSCKFVFAFAGRRSVKVQSKKILSFCIRRRITKIRHALKYPPVFGFIWENKSYAEIILLCFFSSEV